MDLDGDLGAVVQAGAVDLADRGRRDRLGIERGEDLLRWRAQLVDQDGAHLLPRRVHGVGLELAEDLPVHDGIASST